MLMGKPLLLVLYWELVGEVPAELLREEVVDTSTSHDLGQLGRVAKGVWQPELEGGNGTNKRTLAIFTCPAKCKCAYTVPLRSSAQTPP